MVEFLTTASLSQNIFVGPSIGMPIIRSLYCNACIISVAVFAAINSDPKVDVSTVFGCFEYHTISAWQTNNNKAVCDYCVIWFPAWSASTKQFSWAQHTYHMALEHWEELVHWLLERNLSNLPPKTCSTTTVHACIIKYNLWPLVFPQVCKYMKYCF